MIYKHQARLVWIQLMEKQVTQKHRGFSSVRALWTDAFFLLMPSAHTEEQSAALHLTCASGCKDYLEQMLNIKTTQWIVASFSLAKMRQILSLSSQLSAPQAILMHRLEHFPISWRIRILCSNLGTCLVNGLCALFVCCSILATPWSLRRVKRKVKIKLLI